MLFFLRQYWCDYREECNSRPDSVIMHNCCSRSLWISFFLFTFNFKKKINGEGQIGKKKKKKFNLRVTLFLKKGSADFRYPALFLRMAFPVKAVSTKVFSMNTFRQNDTGWYYGLYFSVLPKFLCRSPDSLQDGISRRITRFMWGQEGVAHMMGLVHLKKIIIKSITVS